MKTTLTLALILAMIAAATAYSADLLVDDFSAGSTPPDEGRIYETLLDAGWRATSAYSSHVASAWDITGGRLENPTANTTSYVESETPVWQLWTNPAPSSIRRRLRVTFDYSVGTSDTLTAHFWAVQDGGDGSPSFISNNQGWGNGNSAQNESVSANYTIYNLLDGASAPASAGSITGALTGTGTFVGEIDLNTLGISGVTTVGDIDKFFLAFAANESGGGTTWVDNLSVSDWPPNILNEQFITGGTPPDEGRIYESRLDAGWRATAAYGPHIASAWDITGGRLENPTANTTSYVESETPVWQLWTNPAPSSIRRRLRVTFDYSVGTSDTLTAHFWAVQDGGDGSPSFISNNQGWGNGNSAQNESVSANYTIYNLLDGASPPANAGSITGALTGTGTFVTVINLAGLGIPGVTSVGDIDTFFLAFAGNETGGGTTSVDNISISLVRPGTVISVR